MKTQNVDILDLAKRTIALAEKAEYWERQPKICQDKQVLEKFAAHSRSAAPQLAEAVVSLRSTVAALKELLKFAVERFNNCHLANLQRTNNWP